MPFWAGRAPAGKEAGLFAQWRAGRMLANSCLCRKPGHTCATQRFHAGGSGGRWVVPLSNRRDCVPASERQQLLCPHLHEKC